MKKNIILLFCIFSPFTFSQVGINTSTPKNDLHIVGSLQITNEINVGGSSTTVGDAGTKGYALFSQGSGFAPKWSELNFGNVQKLVYSAIKNTNQSGSGFQTVNVTYNSTPTSNTDYFTYSNNNSFTTVIAGYYNIQSYIYSDLTNGGGTTENYIKVNSNSVFADVTNYSGGNTNMGTSIGGIVYLNVGDVIIQTFTFTRAFTITKSSIIFSYLGS